MEESECSGTIACFDCMGVSGNPNHSYPSQMDKVIILELVSNGPWNEVTSRPDTSLLVSLFGLEGHLTLKTHLDGHQHFWHFHSLALLLGLQRT